jgi:hypothetical protein
MSILSGPRVRPDGSVTQLVSDRHLLVGSLVLALVGWVVMIPPDGWVGEGGTPMSLLQFSIGFTLVTVARARPHARSRSCPPRLTSTLTVTIDQVAFPFGRGVCLSMVGKILGNQPQGAWMGVMFALGAIARIAGPFWAVTGYYVFGSLVVFGSSAVLFGVSLVATKWLWSTLAPAEEDAHVSVTKPHGYEPPTAGGQGSKTISTPVRDAGGGHARSPAGGEYGLSSPLIISAMRSPTLSPQVNARNARPQPSPTSPLFFALLENETPTPEFLAHSRPKYAAQGWLPPRSLEPVARS